ncbi:hypothetical protein KC318_g129 [Hortaea werneckii]|nr:hypothetical protein KC334_g258 [Hortaea werneckii]KAI7027829.1 hypothetical protein KC355_g195 [Hortaea werneckii]KAI7205111.1 hypothetical protein KC324_g465 [Hortaea werneckii]KAI7594613.1 hypothetical protein KC316_g1028 [Hortaea werneckii]KAI7676659.1 hypothetical protein KC318_g129 [Hortaea werneckii]
MQAPTLPRPGVVNRQTIAESSQASQSYVPFAQNRQFTGRTHELEILERKLFVEQDCQKLAVVGPGGIGKTQLVLQFAYAVLQKHPDVSVFWINALSAETFEQACREVARVLSILGTEDGKEDVKELFCRHLNAESAGKWLMVVDNADDIEVLKKGILAYLPVSTSGMIVFTTRDQSTTQAIAVQHTVHLEGLTTATALELFRKAVTRKDLVYDSFAASDLTEELQCLPLAITQAAAYINCNPISVREYLDLVGSAVSDPFSFMGEEMAKDLNQSQYLPKAEAKTWLVCFDKIVRQDPDAAHLLQYMSCIEREAIPHSILPAMESDARLTEAIGTLLSYSVISRRSDSQTYDMHRLVHIAAQVWVRQRGQLIRTQSNALRHLKVIFPSSHYENRKVWREYMPHAIRALEGNEAETVEVRGALCLKVGRCLHVDGRIDDEVRLLEKSLALRNTLDEDHPVWLASQHELGRAYLVKGHVTEAVLLLERVVIICQQNLAEDHPSRLASQYELGCAYLANGQVLKAVQLLEQVLTNQNRALGQDHPARLASQHELGRAYLASGQVREAEELFVNAMEISKKVLGETHPDTLTSIANLASIYCIQGRWAKAEELGLKVVEARKKVLGEAYLSTISSTGTLASNDMWQGRWAEAATLQNIVVGLRNAQHGVQTLEGKASSDRAKNLREGPSDTLRIASRLPQIRETERQRSSYLARDESDSTTYSSSEASEACEAPEGESGPDRASTSPQIRETERQRGSSLARDESDSISDSSSEASEGKSGPESASSQTSYSNKWQEPLLMLDEVVTSDANLISIYVQLANATGDAHFRRIVGKQLKLLFKDLIAEASSSLQRSIRAFVPVGKRKLDHILSGICSRLKPFEYFVHMTEALNKTRAKDPRKRTARWIEHVSKDHDFRTAEQNTRGQPKILGHSEPDTDNLGLLEHETDDSDNGGEEVQEQHCYDIQQVRSFLLQSTSLSRYKERIKLMTNPTQGLDTARANSDLSMIQDLLQYRFNAVAVGPWTWLPELKELGYDASEIAELLLEQHRDHPWIYFENRVTSLDKKPQIDLHIDGCVHRGGEAFVRADIHSVIANTVRGLENEGLEEQDDSTVQIVASLCGLAGVVPPPDSSVEWHGEVLFDGDDVASVSFRTQGVSRTSLWSRINCTLRSFSTAFAVVQQRGQCCDSFTFLRGPSAALPGRVPAIELCSLRADLVLEFAQSLEEVADTPDETTVQSCARRASMILELVSSNLAQSSKRTSMDECVNICGLAVQLLCLSFVFYCQAHTGALELFFLQYRLRHIRLMGTQPANEAGDHVVARLQELTCIGTMLQDSVIVFDYAESPVSGHGDELTAMDLFPDGQTVASTSDDRPMQLWNAQTGEQTERLNDGSDSDSGRFNLLACAQDIVDTWGPATFIVALDVNREEKIASIL